MLKIAITGNIASGKSTVQKIIQDFGYDVIDTDDIAAKLRETHAEIILNAFKGYDISDENGRVSRGKLGQLIFGNDELLQKLADLMHPLIRDEVHKFFVRNYDKKLVFVGIPLLFETEMQNDYDKIILIYTDDEIRLQRLLKRNNYTTEHAKERIKSQLSQDEKIKKSDFVINNNGKPEELERQVKEVLTKLLV